MHAFTLVHKLTFVIWVTLTKLSLVRDNNSLEVHELDLDQYQIKRNSATSFGTITADTKLLMDWQN